MAIVSVRVRMWVFVALGIVLGACGGGEEETAPTARAAPAATGAVSPNQGSAPALGDGTPTIAASPPNHSPTISGNPGTAVMHGTQYDFTPTGSDQDGDLLTYSIDTTPAWASFDWTTGRLSGTPGPEHVGTTTDIVIRVSDGELGASLAPFTLTVHAVANGSATLSWHPPTTNTDGSPVTNLAGYRVYWGSSDGAYPNSVTLNNAGLTAYVVTDLVPGTWFFVATSLNSMGVESAFSSPAITTIQ